MLDFSRANDLLRNMNKNLRLMQLQVCLSSKYADIPNKQSLFYDESYYSKNDRIFILCLFHETDCVSTITCENTCEKTGHIITVASKTHPDHNGRRYNLLLRSCLVLISNLICSNNYNPAIIKSFAVNSISEQSLRKYYDVIPSSREEYVFHLFCNKPNKKRANLLISNFIEERIV